MAAITPPQIGFLHGRIALDLVRRALDQHAAFLQNGDALDQFEQRIHVVIDDDHGAARAIDFSSCTVSMRSRGLMPASGSSSSSRLGRGRQRKADFQPPLFAIGEIRYRRVRALGQIDERERVLDLFVEAGNALQDCGTGRA